MVGRSLSLSVLTILSLLLLSLLLPLLLLYVVFIVFLSSLLLLVDRTVCFREQQCKFSWNVICVMRVLIVFHF